jgi:hypothetical protein
MNCISLVRYFLLLSIMSVLLNLLQVPKTQAATSEMCLVKQKPMLRTGMLLKTYIFIGIVPCVQVVS